MDLNKIFLKENYTLEDLMKEERVIFFDIDSTLGGNTSHHGIYSFEKNLNEKLEVFEAFKKENNVNFSAADFIAVDATCLAMFFRTLKDTNSVAFCISSWVTTCSTRGDKSNINPMTLMEKVFQETFTEWESGTVVGGYSQEPSSRGVFCKKVAEAITADYFIIDDSHKEYDVRDGLVEVDGDCGFVYRDYRTIVEKWKPIKVR